MVQGGSIAELAKAPAQVRANVLAARKYLDWDPKSVRVGEPGAAALRAYREFHPSLRVFYVNRNGRQRWLTWRQLLILRYVDDPHHRNKRLTLRAIAKACHCHATTVRRTLIRFDDWGLFDVGLLVGRFGGTWVQTIRNKAHKWKRRVIDMASRKVARSWLARMIRAREAYKRLEIDKRKPIARVLGGYMGATFT